MYFKRVCNSVVVGLCFVRKKMRFLAMLYKKIVTWGTTTTKKTRRKLEQSTKKEWGVQQRNWFNCKTVLWQK